MVKQEEQFQRTVNNLNNIFQHKADVDRSYGQQGAKHLRDTFKFVTTQLQQLIRNEKVCPTPQQISGINKSLGMLVDVLLYKPFTPLVKDMSLLLGKLIFNWNKSTVNNSQIESTSLLIDRMANMATTLQDLIYLSRKLLHRLDVINERRPEAYTLSKHYLDTLP